MKMISLLALVAAPVFAETLASVNIAHFYGSEGAECTPVANSDPIWATASTTCEFTHNTDVGPVLLQSSASGAASVVPDWYGRPVLHGDATTSPGSPNAGLRVDSAAFFTYEMTAPASAVAVRYLFDMWHQYAGDGLAEIYLSVYVPATGIAIDLGEWQTIGGGTGRHGSPVLTQSITTAPYAVTGGEVLRYGARLDVFSDQWPALGGMFSIAEARLNGVEFLDANGQVVAVPEPAGITLLPGGLVALWLRRRTRNPK